MPARRSSCARTEARSSASAPIGTIATARGAAGVSASSIASRSMPAAHPTPGTSGPPISRIRPSYLPPAITVPWAPSAVVVNSKAVWV